MKRLHGVFPVLIAIAFLFGSSLAQDADVQAIEALSDRYVAAQAERDVEALTALYTDDAILFNSIGLVLEGREALIAYWQAGFEGPPQYLDVDTRETVVIGETGYSIGTYSVMNEEGAVVVHGYFMAIVNRVDGEWRIHRHINNMVMPQMPAPAEENDGT